MQPEKVLENKQQIGRAQGSGLCPCSVVRQSWICQCSSGVVLLNLEAAFESSAVEPCLGDCLSEAWAKLSPISLRGPSWGLWSWADGLSCSLCFHCFFFAMKSNGKAVSLGKWMGGQGHPVEENGVSQDQRK